MSVNFVLAHSRYTYLGTGKKEHRPFVGWKGFFLTLGWLMRLVTQGGHTASVRSPMWTSFQALNLAC